MLNIFEKGITKCHQSKYRFQYAHCLFCAYI